MVSFLENKYISDIPRSNIVVTRRPNLKNNKQSIENQKTFSLRYDLRKFLVVKSDATATDDFNENLNIDVLILS